ncbi:MAG: GntR family transcriptional regulator [Planctomycetota bacterium]
MRTLTIEQFQTQGGVVYAALCDRIARRDLKPGHKLTIREIASELGVSVTPVRDAMNKLRQNGLVEMIPRVGYRVVGLTPETMKGIYAIRRAILSESAVLAADKITDEDIEELNRIAVRMDALKQVGRCEDTRAEALDLAFHTKIAQIAGLPLLEREIARVATLGIAIPTPMPPVMNAHKKVVEALATRDPQIAYRQMREHVDSPLKNQLVGLEAYRDSEVEEKA